MMASSCCGRQEEPAILISRLLLRMRHIYVASIRLDFHREWMECTERNLITPVLTNCHMKLTQSTVVEQKRFDLLSLSLALCNLWLLLVILFFSSNLSWKTVEASLSATLHLACFPFNRIIQTRGHWLGIFIWPSRSGGLGRRNLSESWSNLQQLTMRIRYWRLGMYGYKHFTPLHETDPKRKDIRTEHWLCINKCWEMIPEICMQRMELVSGAWFVACTLTKLQTTHLTRNTYIAECNAVFS